MQRFRREEQTTTKLTKCLLERLRLHSGEAMANSPESTDTSGLDILSIEDDLDSLDSPKTQMCKGILQNSAAMWRAQRKMTKAVIRVLSLDSAQEQIDCPHCHQHICTKSGKPNQEEQFISGVLKDRNETVTGRVAEAELICGIGTLIVKGLSGPELLGKQSTGGGTRRASLQTQPESEADVLAPSGSPQEQSTCLTDEAEPAREPQPLESPRDFAWHASIPRTAEELELEVVASINSSTSDLNSHPPDSPLADVERSTISTEDSCLAYAPRACEEGMQRSQADRKSVV